MLKRQRKPKIKGGKRIAYQLIPRETPVGEPMYRLLEGARISLAWCTSWRMDVDGRITLGKCKKASDLDRELAAVDFVILLSKSWWQNLETTYEQRKALLDHELCHATVKLNPRTLEPEYDERGRKVWRTVKHEIEEFEGVVARHGIWKKDLERFAKTLIEKAIKEPYVPCEKCASSPGWVSADVNGRPGVTRCECRKAWEERRREALAS
jgi:hypothetical protein